MSEWLPIEPVARAPIWVNELDGSLGCQECWYECPCPDKCRKALENKNQTSMPTGQSRGGPTDRQVIDSWDCDL